MKTFLLTLALGLSASAAAQADPHDKWYLDMRNCIARISIEALEQGWGDNVGVGLKDVVVLQKMMPALKRCEAFSKCINDRFEGKVKHCYSNDRRWRAPPGEDGPLEPQGR
jgi:hypothetical protein